MKIIDVHCHIFPQKIAEKAVEAIGSYYGKSMHAEGTVANLLAQGEKSMYINILCILQLQRLNRCAP